MLIYIFYWFHNQNSKLNTIAIDQVQISDENSLVINYFFRRLHQHR